MTGEEPVAKEKDRAQPFGEAFYDHAWPGLRPRRELARLAQPQLHPRLPRGDAARHPADAKAAAKHRRGKPPRVAQPARVHFAAKTTEAVVSSAGEIQKFTLQNGLRLLVREDPRLPLASIGRGVPRRIARRNAGDKRHHASVREGASPGGTTTRTAEARPPTSISRRRRHRERRGQQQFQRVARRLHSPICGSAPTCYPTLLHATLAGGHRAKKNRSSPASARKKSVRRRSRATSFAPRCSRVDPTPSGAWPCPVQPLCSRRQLAAFRDHLPWRRTVAALGFGKRPRASVRELAGMRREMPSGELGLTNLPGDDQSSARRSRSTVNVTAQAR